MFRYILALLLMINTTSYQSLGAPTNPNATLTIANLLTSLANRCENVFLINQIKSQVEPCSDLKAIHGDKLLRCLMFYDINNQLCSEVGVSKLAITEDYSEKINEEQDMNSFCEHTKDWSFSNITEFPRYKQAVDKVKHPVACGKICGVEEFTSDDVNFYCKYYKWGSGMLKQQVGTQDVPSPIVPLKDKVSETNPAVSVPVSNDLTDLQIKTGESKSGEILSANNNDVVKPEPTFPFNVNQSSNPPLPTSENDLTQNKVPVAPDDLPRDEEKPSEITAVKSDTSDNAAGETKPETLEDTQNKPEDTQNKPEDTLKTGVDKEIQLLNNELEKKESAVLENPKGNKIPNDPEDYQDSDEGKEGLGDMQGGDDGDDPVLDDVNNKPMEQKETIKRIETISTFTGERDYYSNPIQEGLSPDEDNFFPFFLTAIILVVLLYILYHNKSKLTKWFFGLVLEGRQANRRRNSRGHAYKRLDTLEQAMSTNTAAPPTKIIY